MGQINSHFPLNFEEIQEAYIYSHLNSIFKSFSTPRPAVQYTKTWSNDFNPKIQAYPGKNGYFFQNGAGAITLNLVSWLFAIVPRMMSEDYRSCAWIFKIMYISFPTIIFILSEQEMVQLLIQETQYRMNGLEIGQNRIYYWASLFFQCVYAIYILAMNASFFKARSATHFTKYFAYFANLLEESVSQKMFVFIFSMKKVFLALAIVMFHQNALLQIMAILITLWAYFLYLVYTRPFKKNVHLIVCLMCELVVIVCMLLAAFYFIQTGRDDKIKLIKWVVYLELFFCIGHASFAFLYLVYYITVERANFRQHELDLRVHPVSLVTPPVLQNNQLASGGQTGKRQELLRPEQLPQEGL